jgi:tetratricopeptide (TPR) repeat protein
MVSATVAVLALGGRIHDLARVSRLPTRSSHYGRLLAIAAVLIASVPIVRFYQAEALRYRARQAIDVYTRDQTGDLNAVVTEAESALHKAVTLGPANAMAWSDLAFALELRALAVPIRAAELAAPAKAAACRALAISAVVPEFWIRFGVASAMQSPSAEAQHAFEQAVQLAPKNSAAWYYYAQYLSFDTKQREAALRAIANCLSLDAGNRAAEALRVKLSERSPDALLVP